MQTCQVEVGQLAPKADRRAGGAERQPGRSFVGKFEEGYTRALID
jgi:hypothetical protein